VVGAQDKNPWSDAGDDEGSEATVGFRLFTVAGLVDAAASAWRHNIALFVSLTLLGLLPLGGTLLTLEYLASVRRLFATTYEYDYLVLLAALALPLLLGWRSICAGAMNRCAVELLRRDALSVADRALLPELTAWGLIAETGKRGLHVLYAGLFRTTMVWILPAAVVVFAIRADPDMEEFVLYAVGISTLIVCASGAALVSGIMIQMMPAAALSTPGLQAKKGSQITARGIGLSFLLGFLFLLLGINLHLFVSFLLTLSDMLFDLDVSYWQQFFSLTNGLWFWTLLLLASCLMEPIAQVAGAFLWVDGRVRRDALDLRGMLATVKREGGGKRRLAGSSRPNPSANGDRVTLGIVLAVALFAGAALSPAPAWAQNLIGSEVGVDDDIRQARQLLSETDDYGWSDLQELQNFVASKEEGAVEEGEIVFWRDVREGVTDVRNTYGDDRDRARARLNAILAGPQADTEPRVVSAADVESELAVILQQEEFVDLASKDVERGRPGVDLKRRRWDRPDKGERQTCCNAGEWNKATPKAPSGIDAPNFEVQGEIFKILAIVLVAIAIGLLLLAFLRRLQSRGATPAGQPIVTPAIELEKPGEEDALAFTPEDWQTRAVRLADGGDYRLAIRSLYLALLVALHRRQFIAYDESKTNWEYETELRAKLRRRRVKDTGHLEAFTRLTGVFDLVWYGERDADRTMFERCLGWARAVSADGRDDA
jgi:hypothetical protein